SCHRRTCRRRPRRPRTQSYTRLPPRAISSAGRAPARQAGGHWFEPSIAHRKARIAGLFSSEGRGVDDEAVADVGGEDALPRLVDPVGGDDLDLGGDAVLGAEV